MHLLCLDPECVGNDLPAGTMASDDCRFCGEPLSDDRGNVLAQGVIPLIEGQPPSSFDALMDALRDATTEVRVVQLSVVRHGDKLLASSLSEDGTLETVSVLERPGAAQVEHVMDLMDGDA